MLDKALRFAGLAATTIFIAAVAFLFVRNLMQTMSEMAYLVP